MGIGGLIIGAVIGNQVCCKVDYYEKTQEKKNGLEVYRLVDHSAVHDSYESYNNPYFDCPICKNPVKDKDILDNFLKLYDKGLDRLTKLISQYDKLVNNRDEINIFDSLEKIYTEINDIKTNYDENKYFKHTCTEKNKECYIIFFPHPKERLEKQTFSFKDERYEYLKWKNDENLKKILITERQKDYEVYQKEKEKSLIEEKIATKRKELLEEWNNIKFNQEYKKYLGAVESVNDQIKFIIGMNWEYKNNGSLLNVFGEASQNLKYLGSKKKLAKYVSEYRDEENERDSTYYFILEFIGMSKEEEEEFNTFAKPTLEAFKKTLVI